MMEALRQRPKHVAKGKLRENGEYNDTYVSLDYPPINRTDNDQAGLDSVKALKQSPDLLILGEVRDPEALKQLFGDSMGIDPQYWNNTHPGHEDNE
ncbi:hypothetical protein ABGV42_01700 [Paenibacillus pabuli]|uniref:hypothetical protein n=1 Tax=Paenibacillus pabuli TaxID=1472 RepID=UPI0032421C3C